MKLKEYEVYDIATEYFESCIRNGYFNEKEAVRWFIKENRANNEEDDLYRIVEEIRELFAQYRKQK